MKKGLFDLQVSQLVMMVLAIVGMVLVITLIRQVPELYNKIPLFRKGQGDVSEMDMRNLLISCRTWHTQGDFIVEYMPGQIPEIAPKITSGDSLCRSSENVETSKSACRSICLAVIQLGDTCMIESDKFGFGCLNPLTRGVIE